MAVDPRQMRTPVVGNSLQQLAAMRANSGKFPILGNVQPMRPMPPAQSPALPMNENTSEVIKEGAFNAAFETLAKKAGVNIIEGVRDVQQVQQQQQVANLQEAAIRNPAIQRLMMAANDSTIAMQSGGLIGMAEQVDEGEPTNIEGFIEGISSAKDKDEFGVPIIEGSKMDPETGIITLPDGRLVDNIRYATKRDLVEGIKNHREVLQDRLQELQKGPRSFRDVDGSLLSFPQAPYFGETKVLEIAAKKAEEDLREYDRKASLALMNYDSYIADGNEPMYSEIVGRPSYSSFPINLVNYGRIKNKRFGGLVNMAEGGDLKVAEGGEFSGRVPGDGHGMEDNVRMPIKEGKEQVATLAVSPSEYVVDSYTMAALGNGNTDEGADVMDETVKQIRKKAYGSEKQPNEINGLAALKPLIERV
jgi:hypothetical protein